MWSGDTAHAHEWAASSPRRERKPEDVGASRKQAVNAASAEVRTGPLDGLCACGAWRGCLGNEPTLDLYVAHMVEVFREVRRVLRDDGVCFIVLGDSYASGKPESPFRREPHVRACGSGGTEPRCCPGTGCACSCHGDERRDGSANHPRRNARSTRPGVPTAPPAWQITRGSAQEGSGAAPLGVSLPGGQASTIVSDAHLPAESAPPELPPMVRARKELRASSPGAGLSAHRPACSCGRILQGATSASGSEDMEPSSTAYPSLASNPPAGNLLGVPWRVALALQADGWLLRNDVVWAKKAPMPESVSGVRWQRCRAKMATTAGDDGVGRRPNPGGGLSVNPRTEWADCPGCPKCAANDGLVLRRGAFRHTRAHEFVFMLAKSAGYYCDAEAAAEKAIRAGCVVKAYRGGSKNGQQTGPAANLYKGFTQHDTVVSGRNPRSFMLLGPAPLKEAHYAAFPSALIEPLIKVSTSARGVCPACGAPWARVVERGAMVVARSDYNAKAGNNGRTATAGTMVEPPESRTLGWRATCGCVAGDPVSAIVLDPFVGSGTTMRVAIELGRRAVGIDLSHSYLRDIAAKRTSGVQLPLLNDSL